LAGWTRRKRESATAEAAGSPPAAIVIAYRSEDHIVECLRSQLDGEPASAIRKAIADGKLFGAGLRDLVGRHALRGGDLAAFVLHDVLERPFAEIARTLGADPRTVRRWVEQSRVKLQLAADADLVVIGQWLVTELIAPPTRALQLRLFTKAAPAADASEGQREKKVESHEQRPTEAEDHRQAGLAVEKGEPRA